jgi:hypothetical protein
MRRSIGIVVGLTLVLFACRDGIYPGFEPKPGFVIADGNQSGNPHVFVLGPIGSDDPSGHGTFNPSAQPTFVMCRWANLYSPPTDGCAGVLSVSQPTITLDQAGEFFQYRWRSGDGGHVFEPRAVYRIQIYWGDYKLGHADVQVLENSNDKPDDDPSGIPFYGSQLTSGFNIKVRIDEGALCWAKFGDSECVEGSFNTDEGGELTIDDEIYLIVLPGFLDDGEHTFTLARVTERPCLPTSFKQYDGCYKIEVEPPLEGQFNAHPDLPDLSTVLVGMCLDPTVTDPEDQIGKFKGPAPDESMKIGGRFPGGALIEALGEIAAFAGTPPCDNAPPSDGGYFAALRTRLHDTFASSLVRRSLEFFFGSPAVAGDVSHFSSIWDFTHLGFVRAIELGEGGGGGLTGASVPVSARVMSKHVLVNHDADPDLIGVSGVLVQFECKSVVSGGGICPAGTKSAASNGGGFATTYWTFAQDGTYRFEATTPGDGAEPFTFDVVVVDWQAAFLTPVADSNPAPLPTQNTTASGWVRIDCAGSGCSGPNPRFLAFDASNFQGGRYQVGWKIEGAQAGDVLTFSVVLGAQANAPLPGSHPIVVASAPKYNVNSNLPVRFRIER